MWLLVAILAQFVNGSSTVIDKLLLKKSYPNPVGYTFWLGILGLFSVVFIPFGFRALSPEESGVALLAGAIFILAMLFYFLALFHSQTVSSVIFIGAISPIFTFAASWVFLGISLHSHQLFGFIFLIIGGLALFLSERNGLNLKVLFFSLTSALLFGFSNTLTKIVFNFTNFPTGFVWIKAGGIVAVLSFLFWPAIRRKIFSPEGKDEFRSKTAYFLNRGYAGFGSVLIYYAILLGSPSLVDATYNVKYLFVFLGGWLFLGERPRGKVLAGKILALLIISFAIIWLSVGEYYTSGAWRAYGQDREIKWGITFSQKFSEMLGLDWRENYGAILNELKPARVRLIAYWDKIEPEDNKFDFNDLDWQMDLAAKNKVGVILAVGRKLPRWPECHAPEWAKNPESGIWNPELLEYIKETVNRYKNHPALLYWQAENEPFLPFGECPAFDKEFLDKEIALVKSLDSAHPIIITDSGELGLWYRAAKRGDVFGTTMYRRVHNEYLGYVDYHLPPQFFWAKQKLTRWFVGDSAKKYVVIELAAEPWLPKQLYETSTEEQFKHFDLDFFKNTIDYAKATGFDEYYLWGAEWWYWLKTKQSHPEFWDYAKTIN
ncbi:MAG: EamA family transporter [Patescibacteria group bacterium]|mgnify:CR=1 FL=1